MKIMCVKPTYQFRKRHKVGDVIDFQGEEKDIPAHFKPFGKRKVEAPIVKDPVTLKEMQDTENKRLMDEKKKKDEILGKKKDELENAGTEPADFLE